MPGEPGIAERGLRYPWVAATEGGPRNGVLTAIEDFVALDERLRLVVVPAFFGFGAVWSRDSRGADALDSLLDPWDRNPVLQRLEHSRVTQLVSALADREQLLTSETRRRRQEELLRTMLASKAFAVGEQLSRLRQRGRAVFSRSQVREALGERGADQAL